MSVKKVAAVIGKPILHSASPLIFKAAGKEYLRLAVSDVKEALQLANEMGLVGVNVTAPFKEEAYSLIEKRSIEAERTKAVNTIVGLVGYNTDCYGVSKCLEDVDTSEALVLGAGGAARAAVFALLESSARVTVLNRSLEKAKRIACEFGVLASDLSYESQAQHFSRAKVIINCTSTCDRFINPEFLKNDHLLLDSQYARSTALAEDLRIKGGRVIDGYEWLLNQAVRSFSLIFDEDAPLSDLRRGLVGKNVESGKPIALGGLMGAGKTEVGKRVAEVIKTEFIDIDEEIERTQGKSIKEIFKSDGEKKFRELESKALSSALSSGAGVISLGGGIVLSEKNRELLSESSLFFWLWATPEELARRLDGDTSRPLLEGYDSKERLLEILSERIDLYQSVCDVVIPTAGHSIDDIAERVIYETSFAR